MALDHFLMRIEAMDPSVIMVFVEAFRMVGALGLDVAAYSIYQVPPTHPPTQPASQPAS